MSELLSSVFGFIFAIMILVPFHEWGHFWVARRLGVKVLRFSVGFGKVIFSHVSQSGVEYRLSWIPLGGYVKMLDEREGEVPPELQNQAFNRQVLWKRACIVAAGPIANVLLAFLLLIPVYRMGFDDIAPIIGKVAANSIAEQAGVAVWDEIVTLNSEPVPGLQNLRVLWLAHWDDSQIKLTTRSAETGQTHTYLLSMPQDLQPADQPFEKLGITFDLPAQVGIVEPGSAADKAGLQSGDWIVGVGPTFVRNWSQLVSAIAVHPDETLDFTLKRNNELMTIPVKMDVSAEGNGRLGIHLPEKFLREGKFSLIESIFQSFQQTVHLISLNFKMFYDMLFGKISAEHLGGPVSIAQAAGASAQQGVSAYLSFLALISIGLAVLNLLPIPLLDGGHLLFYLIEMVRGRALSERAEQIGLRIGIVILLSLMLLAFYNDMMRF